MKYQDETVKEYRKLKDGTVAQHQHQQGLHNNEPLTVCMDSMLRYAKAYKRAYGGKIADDGVLGVHFLDTIKGIRGLLDGQGAYAMETCKSTDSKDNGCIETIFWTALHEAGFTEKDI